MTFRATFVLIGVLRARSSVAFAVDSQSACLPSVPAKMRFSTEFDKRSFNYLGLLDMRPPPDLYVQTPSETYLFHIVNNTSPVLPSSDSDAL